VFAVGHVQCSWAGELPRCLDRVLLCVCSGTCSVFLSWRTSSLCWLVKSLNTLTDYVRDTLVSELIWSTEQDNCSFNTDHTLSIRPSSLVSICVWFVLLRCGTKFTRLVLKFVKLPQILHFWPHFLGGGGPQFSDLHYKSHPDSDHVAKFHGYQPRELGDRVAK